jgi:hypothetical protein
MYRAGVSSSLQVRTRHPTKSACTFARSLVRSNRMKALSLRTIADLAIDLGIRVILVAFVWLLIRVAS